jgi:hypothetical protein
MTVAQPDCAIRSGALLGGEERPLAVGPELESFNGGALEVTLNPDSHCELQDTLRIAAADRGLSADGA